MERTKVILIGAGGHAKSVVDAIDKDKMELIGFIDDNKTGIHCRKPILGDKIEEVDNFQSYSYLVSIGDVSARKKWFDRLKRLNCRIINIIDKSAIISETAQIGNGNFIGKYAIINADVVIGDNNVINSKALIEHECVVGNHTHLSTNSTINGNVVVEDSVFYGSSSVCNGQLKICSGSIVGSGSVVIKDVPPSVIVVGNPARVIKRRHSNE